MSNTVPLVRVGLPVAYVGSRDHEDQSPRAVVDRALAPPKDDGDRGAAFSTLAVGIGVGATSLLARSLPGGVRIGGALLGVGLAITSAMMLSMDRDDTVDPASKRPDVAFNQVLREGPTPAGGAYSIASYLDANGQPVVKGDAASVEIVEFDDAGGAIAHTSAQLPSR